MWGELEKYIGEPKSVQCISFIIGGLLESGFVEVPTIKNRLGERSFILRQQFCTTNKVKELHLNILAYEGNIEIKDQNADHPYVYYIEENTVINLWDIIRKNWKVCTPQLKKPYIK